MYLYAAEYQQEPPIEYWLRSAKGNKVIKEGLKQGKKDTTNKKRMRGNMKDEEEEGDEVVEVEEELVAFDDRPTYNTLAIQSTIRTARAQGGVNIKCLRQHLQFSQSGIPLELRREIYDGEFWDDLRMGYRCGGRRKESNQKEIDLEKKEIFLHCG